MRSLAHHIKPSIYIGKSGLTEGAIKSIDQSLDSHELIKVKFNNNKASKAALASSAEEKLLAFVVGSIGNTLIIFRPHEDHEQRKYNI